MVKTYDLIIGIDTGVKTGFAVWNRHMKRLIYLDELKIHRALLKVLAYQEKGLSIFLRIEDARLRKWIDDKGKDKDAMLQGVGSVKRDAKIWEEFCKDFKLDFELVAPKHNKTKLEPGYFAGMTGIKRKTSDHERDATMLVFNWA